MRKLVSSTRTMVFTAFCLAALIQPTRSQAGLENCTGDLTPSNVDNPIVELNTNMGSICIELLEDQAPITVANFLNYANRGDYDGIMFHRSVPGSLIQGGAFHYDGDSGFFEQITTDPTILNEPCTLDDPIEAPIQCSVRGNERGTVAMAKGSAVNSATSQWFINMTDNRSNAYSLDSQTGGFTVFARVLGEGMDVVDAIAGLERLNNAEFNLVVPTYTTYQALGELPVTAQPVEDPAGYGCFDVNELTRLLAADGLSRDPTTGVPTAGSWQIYGFYGPDPIYWMLSGACGTALADWLAFVEDNPSQSQSCTTIDRLGVGASGTNIGIQVDHRDVLDNSPASLAAAAPYSFTCDQVNESFAQLDNRRVDMSPKTAALTVKVIEAVVVPEPSQNLLALTSLLSLCSLARRRRRNQGE